MTDDATLARLLASLEEIAAEDELVPRDPLLAGFYFIAGEDVSDWFLGSREPRADACRITGEGDGTNNALRRLAAGEYCNPYHAVAESECVWELPAGDGPWELTIERPGAPPLRGSFGPDPAI